MSYAHEELSLHSQEQGQDDRYQKPRRNRSNFVFLSLGQLFVLLKRSFFLHVSFFFSTILRLLFPALAVLFIFLFRLAIVTQVAKTQASVTKYSASEFKILSHFEDSSVTPFLYSDKKCTHKYCADGSLRSLIMKKLQLEEKDVLEFDPADSPLDYYKQSFTFMGGVHFNTSPYDGHIDVTFSSNYSASYASPFSVIRDQFPFDFTFNIEKATFEALAELGMKSLHGNQTNNMNETLKSHFSLSSSKYPSVASVENDTDSIYHSLLPSCLLITFIILGLQAHYHLNQEKQTKARTSMRMMGLRQSSYWLSMLITYSIITAIASVLAIAFGFIFQVSFISYTSPIVMFLLLFLFGLAMVTNFFLCSTCCVSSRSTNVNAFIVLGVCLFFVLLLSPAFSVLRDVETHAFVTLGSLASAYPGGIWLFLFPAFNFYKISLDISSLSMTYLDMETTRYMRGPGFGIADLFTTYYPKNYPGSTPFSSVLALLFSICFNFLLTLYFDNIIPHISGGVSLPFYYPILPSYWGLFLKRDASNLGVDVALHHQNKFSSVLVDTDEDIYQEYQSVVGSLETDVGENQAMPIKVVKVSKAYMSLQGIFSGSNKTALDSLTFSCNRDEITVLLGHNGGGKSTALNILTGVISLTAGDALFDGLSVVHNMDHIRSNMGVCMQEDIIFEGLSGYQMMELFAFIKGIPMRDQRDEIYEKLNLVGLWKFRNQKATTYSGGMKRRLSLAIACLNDPKFIILDEICSGVDPAARRVIWNILGELKKDRCILLSTHDLYEAEMIADKVVILALGRTRGVGTLQHLKQRYGGALSVRTVTDKPEELKEKVLTMLPGSEIETEAHGSIVFNLPRSITPQMLQFFNFLEDQTKLSKIGDVAAKAQILLKDFDLSQTSLEQIFLRLTHGGKKGVFNNNNHSDTPAYSDQLNVTVENETSCLGFVTIASPAMTMDTVRLMILQEIEGAPKDFEFLSNGIPLSRTQEPLKLATQFSPLVVIRPKHKQTSEASKEVMTEELNKLRGALVYLEERNRQLNDEVERLRALLANTTTTTTTTTSQEDNLLDL